MSNDSDLKPEYDFKTLRKADPARHRAILARGERLRLMREIITSVESEEELLEMPAPWDRDPRMMARLLESIAQAKAGQRVEAALETPTEESAVTMGNDSDIKPKYDFKTLRKADASRHRAILARGKSGATVNQDDAANSTALDAEFPIKPSSDLLALAGIAKSDMQVHARDRAEDAARLEVLEELTREAQELGMY